MDPTNFFIYFLILTYGKNYVVNDITYNLEFTFQL